jgi:hypothetical protein
MRRVAYDEKSALVFKYDYVIEDDSAVGPCRDTKHFINFCE